MAWLNVRDVCGFQVECVFTPPPIHLSSSFTHSHVWMKQVGQCSCKVAMIIVLKERNAGKTDVRGGSRGQNVEDGSVKGL